MNHSDISVVIPVREGSSRVRDKIFLPFSSSTLLEWKIAQLMEVHPADKIFLSSNSAKVKSICANLGVNYLQRSDYLCDGHKASFSEVITGIVKDIQTPYFAWVTVVVPLMAPCEYLDAFNHFKTYVVEKNMHDSLASVNLLKDYLWNAKGPLNYRPTKITLLVGTCLLYRITNGLYMRDVKKTLEEGYFLEKILIFTLSRRSQELISTNDRL